MTQIELAMIPEFPFINGNYVIKWLRTFCWRSDYDIRSREFVLLKSISNSLKPRNDFHLKKGTERDGKLAAVRGRKKWSIKRGFAKLNKITSHKLYNSSVNVRCSWSRIILATDNIFLLRSFLFTQTCGWVFLINLISWWFFLCERNFSLPPTILQYPLSRFIEMLKNLFLCSLWAFRFLICSRLPSSGKAIWSCSHTLPTC